MWPGFDPHAYDRAGWTAHVAALPPLPWVKGITLHNTAAPTLKQWVELGPAHDARLANLQSYYENQLGWHAGPHAFISRSHVNGFSDLTKPGVHSRCFNATHIGIEMAGDFGSEPFDSGDGAMVRDTAVFALATLYRKLKLNPGGLTFHKECTLDNHDCPGRLVNKTDVIARIKAAVAAMGTAGAEDPAPAPVTAPVTPRQPWEEPAFIDTWRERLPAGASYRLAWVQLTLNIMNPASKVIPVDGLDGPMTKSTVTAFQRFHGLTEDGVAGDIQTIPSLKAALAAFNRSSK